MTQPVFRRFNIFIALLVLGGAGLRFSNLDQKPYWFNEAFTALRISGYDEHREVNPKLYSGREISPLDIQVFQRPNSEKSYFDTVNGLAQKEPQQPPLYFILARLGAQIFGSTVLASRGLSALFGLLSLLALFWLGRELYGGTSTAWIAVGLAAVSPFFIRYAQEARPYSMWAAAILAGSAAFLRGIRSPTPGNWIAYTMIMVLALYTHFLSILVLAAHGLYMYFTGGVSGGAKKFTTSALACLAAFTPWLIVMLTRLRTMLNVGGYLSRPAPWTHLVESWLVKLSRLFAAWPPEPVLTNLFLALPILLLIAYSFYTLFRTTPTRTWLFVLLLVAIPPLPFLLPDLLLGGQRSTQERYWLPAFLGVELSVAYLLAHKTGQSSRAGARAWQGVLALILLLGLGSSAASVQASTWWGLSQVDLDITDLFNQSPHTLVISDVPFGVIAPISYQLRPEVRFILTKQPKNLAIPSGYNPVYLYQPSEPLHRAVMSLPQVQLRLVYQKPREEGTVYSIYQLVRE